MIRVTQGHEKGIGLEIFLKAYLTLKKEHQKLFKLYCFRDSLESTLINCKIPFQINKNSTNFSSSDLSCEFLKNKNLSETMISLNKSIRDMDNTDILLTLPSSKDQFKDDDNHYNGHTEYFRQFFKNNEITMSFLSSSSNFLLLTDHIDINEVSKSINEKLITEKIKHFLDSKLPNREIKEVFFSGINPHCGENGYISKDDEVINKAIETLKKRYQHINFHNMQAGDTLHFNIKNKSQLFIYSSHDQGLGVFKLKYGLTGINFSCGLPFKRVSVDHGTAFNLFGKNQASYIGMTYLMDEILSWT